MSAEMTKPSAASPGAVAQEQFLTILSREDALARFEAALFPRELASEVRLLGDALGFPLAHDVVAAVDVPPFDRSNVDGFAVRSADLASAGEAAAVRLSLNGETIACGTAPTLAVMRGNGDADRDRRAAAARRRCRGDGRAQRARGRGCGRYPPRRDARASSCPMRDRTLRAARCCCAPAR